MIFSLALIKPSLYIIGPTERTEPLAKVLSPGGRHIHLHKSFVLLSARGQVRTTSSSPGRPLGGSKGPLSRRRRGPRTTYSKKWAKFFWTIIHLPPTPPGLPIFFKKQNYRHTLITCSHKNNITSLFETIVIYVTGELEVCGTSDERASLHNPVSPVKITC
jgi:hypothetical protein